MFEENEQMNYEAQPPVEEPTPAAEPVNSAATEQSSDYFVPEQTPSAPVINENGSYSWRPAPPAPPVPPVPPVQNAAPAAGKPGKKPKKGWTAGKIIALALCCAILGGLFGFGGSWLASKLSDKPVSESKGSTAVYQSGRKTADVDVIEVDGETLMTASQVYAANVNSTVGITTSITTNYWGYQTTAAASGSGFIITEDGYILTNYHVIEDSDSITVTTFDNESYDAELIGYDESNDIAVLKIESEEAFVPVVLGDSDNIYVGDGVIAIGNPLGELTFSLTSGVVSALDRQVTLSSGVTMDLIQTDCAINSGNSGGALFNMYGEVVGITNAKYSGSGYSSEASIDNIGFAIPINTVNDIVESIIENGYIAKPYIGVSVMDVSTETQDYGLPAGAAVKAVTEGGPAEAAGVCENDIITECNGTEISGSDDLVEIVKECEVGDELKLKIYRQGETVELTVTVQEQISSAIADEDEVNQSASGEMNGSQYGNQYGSQYGNQYGSDFDPFEYFFGNMFGY